MIQRERPSKPRRANLRNLRTRLWKAVIALAAIGGAVAAVGYFIDAGGEAASRFDQIVGAHKSSTPTNARASSGASAVGGVFYPARQAYPYAACKDSTGVCGSADGPVFNTFGDSPFGDERSFLDGRRSEKTKSGSYSDPVRGVTGGTRRVTLRLYVNNDADPETNKSGVGVARGTRVRIKLPTATSNVLRVRGYVSAENAEPRTVENTLDLLDSQRFSVRYVPGSAVMYNNTSAKNGLRMSDTIVRTEGTLVGTNKLDGRVLGGFRYVLVVEVELEVRPAG